VQRYRCIGLVTGFFATVCNPSGEVQAALRHASSFPCHVEVASDSPEPGTPPRRERRRLDLMAALEFLKLYEHVFAKKPADADDRVGNAVRRALQDAWGFRRIRDFVEGAIAGRRDVEATSTSASAFVLSPPLMERSPKRLTIDLTRLPTASDAELVFGSSDRSWGKCGGHFFCRPEFSFTRRLVAAMRSSPGTRHRRTTTERLVPALFVEEDEVPADAPLGVEHAVVRAQKDLLVLQRSPQPLHEDVVQAPALSVHGDADASMNENLGEGLGGELHALSRCTRFRLMTSPSSRSRSAILRLP
jgi:hypothetical protein